MHWFWRAAIAVGVGCMGGFVFYHAMWTLIYAVTGRTNWTDADPLVVVVWYIQYPVTALAGVVPYALLTHLVRARNIETRCRRCGYILRGITEPRCPECEEAI